MMKSKLVPSIAVLFLAVTLAAAQQTDPVLAMLDQVKALYSQVLAQEQAIVAGINARLDGHDTRLNAHDASFQSQSAQVQALTVRVTALETAVAALQPAPPPPAPVTATLSFAGLPDGPITAPIQGVTFSSGNWVIIGGQLAPAFDNQPTRSISFSSAVLVQSVTYSMTSIALADNNGQRAVGAVVGADIVLNTKWTKPSSSFTVGGTNGPAPNLRIREIVYLP